MCEICGFIDSSGHNQDTEIMLEAMSLWEETGGDDKAVKGACLIMEPLA